MPAPVEKRTAGTVGALILAGGFSRRFGGIKLRARLKNGKTVFAQTLERIASATPNILVVTRDELPDIEQTVVDLGFPAVQTARCPDSHLGMGHTLAFGIASIPQWTACLVCLGDMPFISTNTYAKLLATMRSDVILVPQHDGVTGNPIGFGNQFYAALRQVHGDTGGREVLRVNRDKVQVIAVDDSAILQDIDTQEDLIRLDKD